MVSARAPTDIDEQILHALTHCVRMFTIEQLATTWWQHLKQPQQAARRWATKFQRRRDILIEPTHAVTKFPAIKKAVICWDPGNPDPDFKAISEHLQERWKKLPSGPAKIILATRRAGSRLGGHGGKHNHRDQVTHDLRLSQVYLHVLTTHPVVAKHWKGEECYRAEREGQKLPDAIIYDGGVPPEVLLVVGAGGASFLSELTRASSLSPTVSKKSS